MSGELIASLFLSTAALVAASKAIKDYFRYEKERHIEGLGASANEKIIKRIETLETNQKDMNEKLSNQEGIIEAIFKMRKD